MSFNSSGRKYVLESLCSDETRVKQIKEEAKKQESVLAELRNQRLQEKIKERELFQHASEAEQRASFLQSQVHLAQQRYQAEQDRFKETEEQELELKNQRLAREAQRNRIMGQAYNFQAQLSSLHDLMVCREASSSSSEQMTFYPSVSKLRDQATATNVELKQAQARLAAVQETWNKTAASFRALLGVDGVRKVASLGAQYREIRLSIEEKIKRLEQGFELYEQSLAEARQSGVTLICHQCGKPFDSHEEMDQSHKDALEFQPEPWTDFETILKAVE